jgi:hypothetical protein
MIGRQPDDGVASEPERNPADGAVFAGCPADVADGAGFDSDPELRGGAARQADLADGTCSFELGHADTVFRRHRGLAGLATLDALHCGFNALTRTAMRFR